MRAYLMATVAAASMGCGLVALLLAACSSSSSGSTADAGDAATAPFSDAGASDSGPTSTGDADAGGMDASDAAPFATGVAIVSANGGALQGAPGDALGLSLAITMSDGTTRAITTGQVSWLAPTTIVAQSPYDAGATDILPEAGAAPTAFFVHNDYGATNAGVLYIVDPGTVASPTVTVSAALLDAGEVTALVDGGEVTATVAILPPLVGDAATGELLFQSGPHCASCHGTTGGGTPPALLPDGGLILVDGGPVYALSGEYYPYPAPGLNAAPDSGNLASDPAWNAALLALAAQGGIDNNGVALRVPMPDWYGGTGLEGGTLRGQDFADIYAWLRTQTE